MGSYDFDSLSAATTAATSTSTASATAGGAAVSGALELAPLLAQAQAIGYANHAQLITASVPWRPIMAGMGAASGIAGALHAGVQQPSAPGAQTAVVVGPSGSEHDTSGGDVFTDKLGRIRIRLLWQGTLADADGASSGSASCWVRVAQRSAGAGMGLQFIPRVGQEVLVQFLGGDIDRPIVVGALYNGQGEGGVKPTPGGQDAKGAGQDSNPHADNPFQHSSDQRAAGQGNLMAAGTGGKSPPWFGSVHGKHGASEAALSAGGQANSAAVWGIRTKEWGNADPSSGYNQLVFDDNDSASQLGGNQQRIHLKTTQSATELSLGHLIHSADNHRGSLRGQGFELRTDAYGAIRAGAGLHISTYPIGHSASSRDSAGDNSAALALLKQAGTLASSFSKAAGTHTTARLASCEGAQGKAQSAINAKAAPLAALHKSAATQVGTQSLAQAQSDAGKKGTSPSADKLPHSGDAILSLAAQGGITAAAGQSLQCSNSETISLASGQDSQNFTGGSLRMHSGQAIGLLAGAVGKGETVGAGSRGLTLAAGKDPVRLEAQAGEIHIQAKQRLNIQSANAHIDWAAAKKISLSTAQGANITLQGGNITIQCPGKLTVHASAKKFDGPAKLDYPLPVLPNEKNTWVDIQAHYDDAWNTPWPLSKLKFDVGGKVVTQTAKVNKLK
jgi:type VI secretion system secreted protein VgrG